MPAHAAYDLPVSFPPRFLETGLPLDGRLTADTVRSFPADPQWRHEYVDGSLLVSSATQKITRDEVDLLPELPLWRYELHDGTLLVTPNAPRLRHQDVALSLAILLRAACPPGLKTVIGPFEWLPNAFNSFQPDLLVARRPVPEARLVQPPVLVVEVLSSSTRRFDETRKRLAYAALGVEHYWIVDPRQPSIEALRLIEGDYVTVAKADAGDRFTVAEPVPLSLDPADLLHE
jgi:Uma2 family endonuclease